MDDELDDGEVPDEAIWEFLMKPFANDKSVAHGDGYDLSTLGPVEEVTDAAGDGRDASAKESAVVHYCGTADLVLDYMRQRIREPHRPPEPPRALGEEPTPAQ